MLYHNSKSHAVYVDGRLIPPGESREVNPSLVPLDQRPENGAQPAGIPGQLGVVAGETIRADQAQATDAALRALQEATEAPAGEQAAETGAEPPATATKKR